MTDLEVQKRMNTMSYEEFEKEVATLIKPYQHLKSNWRVSKFRKLHKDGMSPKEVAGLWVLNAN